MYNFKPGQRLIIKLKNECYIGDFNGTNASYTRIDISNVQDFSTGEKFSSGVQRFYRSEIESLTPLESDPSVTNDVKISPSPVAATTCLISASDLDTIFESIRSAEYFYHTDRAYYAAIEDIKVQPHIGLAVELVTEARVSLITVSVPSTQKIYIFDVISLGRIPNDLKVILHSKTPQKILHNCRSIAVALKRNKSVQLQSIFDTLVAHISLDSSKIASLKECLQTHLNFPSSLWIQYTDDVNWLTRPLDDERKKIAAQNAAYLSQLYSFFHNRMLKPFYEQCHEFAAVNCTDAEELEEAFFDVCCNPNAAAHKIAPIKLNFDGVAAALLQKMNCKSVKKLE